MKRFVASLLAMLLLLYSFGACGESFGGSGTLNPRDRWLEDLGDSAPLVKELLSGLDVEYQSARGGAYLTLTNASHSVGLRLVQREGRTYLMTSATQAAPLSHDLVGLLFGACTLESSANAYRAAMTAALPDRVKDLPAYDDVYNSLFTTCRFLELEGADTAEFLARAEIAALLPLTGVSAEGWQRAAEAGSVHAELTVYQAGEQILSTIDLSAPDMPDAYISYLQDDMGLTFCAASDTAPVSDWDDALEAIARGDSPTGQRTDAFILQFDDLGGKETYLEYTRATAEANTTFEISNLAEAGGEAALEVMVKKNGLRMLEINLNIHPGDETEPLDEPEYLPDELAQEAIAAYFASMDGGFETLLPALHALIKN